MFKKFKVGLVSGSAVLLLAACGGQEEPTNNSASSTTESSDSNAETANFEGKNFEVTYEQAIADFQEAYPDAAISSVDFDEDFGEYSFEINGFDDTQEIEWEVNAENGEEIQNKTEKKDADNDDRELMVNDLMTIKELIKASEDEAQNALLVSWNLEADDDTTTPLFTGEFIEGNNEIDVHLNAETGEFISIEND